MWPGAVVRGPILIRAVCDVKQAVAKGLAPGTRRFAPGRRRGAPAQGRHPILALSIVFKSRAFK
jgi:hypothetical protein